MTGESLRAIAQILLDSEMKVMVKGPAVLLGSCLLAAVAVNAVSVPCAQEVTPDGIVCVCNSTYCDSLSLNVWDASTWPSSQELQQDSAETSAIVVSSSSSGERFSLSSLPEGLQESSSSDTSATFRVDLEKKYQTIKGFGASITDSVVENLSKLKEGAQQKLIEAYFADDGLRYSIVRIPIGSNDFSPGVYSYQDNPLDDFSFSNFSISRDVQSGKISTIKRVTNQYNVKLFASSWAPPAWMCEGGRVIDCRLKGNFTDERYPQALALYYSKFLSAYKEQNISFWAMTAQNEPFKQPLSTGPGWQSLRLSPQQERDFIKNALGPLLAKDHPSTEIIMLDDQRDLLPAWADVVLSDPEAAKYVSGIGIHWYSAVDFMIGEFFKNVEQTYNKYNTKYILATEACEGFHPLAPRGVLLGAWGRGENYARDIIGDLSAGVSGWVDWNMVLNMEGGPTWVGNYVDSPIVADVNDTDKFYKQPMYYALGHFSKFVPPGSVRVDSVLELPPWAASKATNSSSPTTPSMAPLYHSVSFITPTNLLVTVILSREKNKTLTITARNVTASGKDYIIRVPPLSLHSVVWKLPASMSQNDSSASSKAPESRADSLPKLSSLIVVVVFGALLGSTFI